MCASLSRLTKVLIYLRQLFVESTPFPFFTNEQTLSVGELEEELSVSGHVMAFYFFWSLIGAVVISMVDISHSRLH